MTNEAFELIVDKQLKLCKDTLIIKGNEYAPDKYDRFAGFVRGANVMDTTPMKCLLGYFTKHLVSIQDMIKQDAQGRTHSTAEWDEKITDAINYLILLKAMGYEKAEGVKCKTSE